MIAEIEEKGSARTPQDGSHHLQVDKWRDPCDDEQAVERVTSYRSEANEPSGQKAGAKSAPDDFDVDRPNWGAERDSDEESTKSQSHGSV